MLWFYAANLGDHAMLEVQTLESFHKKAVTVRTKSGENLSQDSMPCQIPDDLLKFNAHRKMNTRHVTNQRHLRHAIQATGSRAHRVRGGQIDVYATGSDGQLIDQMNRINVPQIGECCLTN
jgi:hypothetical protein